MNLLHISALPIWPIRGKGGMPSLRETVYGHVREGHEVVMVLPRWSLFDRTLTEIEAPEDVPFEVDYAPCRWLPALHVLREGAYRISPGGQLLFPLRWALNMTMWLCLTVSMVLAGLRARRRLARGRSFNLVYAHNQYTAIAGWLLGGVLHVPNVTRLYGTFVAELMGKPLVWLRYPVAAGGFLVPHSLLICGNDGTRGDEVAEKLGIDLAKFRFWQNGLDLPDRPPDITKRELADQVGQGLRPEAVWACSCSRLSYWKRIDRLIRAVAGARSQGHDVQLVVAGDGEEKANLVALADELGVSDSIIWLGAVSHDRIWEVMNCCDVFLIANDVTNRCNPLYEAISAGLPVVSIYDGSTRDLLTYEHNAMLADREDEPALAACLARLCDDPSLRDRLSSNQSAVADTFWTWPQRLAEEVRELESLTRRGPGGQAVWVEERSR
jgi:glycosyltransferase involved in cell wall biosynthesis